MNEAMIPMIARAARPPTTPPIMVPVLVPEEGAALEVAEGAAEAVSEGRLSPGVVVVLMTGGPVIVTGEMEVFDVAVVEVVKAVEEVDGVELELVLDSVVWVVVGSGVLVVVGGGWRVLVVVGVVVVGGSGVFEGGGVTEG